MLQHDNFEFLKSLLPIYGESGTLKNRSSKLLKGKVITETGTETTAITISGYLYTNTIYLFNTD